MSSQSLDFATSSSCNCLLSRCPIRLRSSLSLHGLQATCMSVASSVGNNVELTVSVRDLRVTIVGPLSSASQLAEDLARLDLEDSASAVAGSQPGSSTWALPSEPVQPSSSLLVESREEILASFPPCPDSCLHSARRLVGLVSDTEFRVRRAWTAGHWAKAVLGGRISSPSRTPQISVRSRIYVVLRVGTNTTPRCFSSSGSYWKCIGTFRDSNSISHSFPSETEARIYCSAAGVQFPTIEP